MREDKLTAMQVSAYSIGVMLDVLERAGIDATSALLRAGLPLDGTLPSSGIISARAELAFEREFTALTPGRRDLWAQIGRRHRLPAYGLFGATLVTSPTLGDWVRASGLARDLCFSFADYRPVTRNGQLCGIEFCLDGVPPDLREMTLFRDLGALSAVLEDLWCGPTGQFHIELAASAHDGRIIEETFPFKVRFDCPTTILTWPAPLTDVPLPYGSARIHQCNLDQCLALQRKIPGNELEARIARVIMLNPALHNTIQAVAQRLNMSVRTLQRRLQDEGLTFRSMLDRSRCEVATESLRHSPMSIAQIAEHMGYSDRTSFDIAFARWTGRSPRRYREECKEQGTVVPA